MYFGKSFLVAAVAGTAIAATPPGFLPAAGRDLQLAFCDNLAVDGVDVPQDGQWCVFS